MAGSTFVHASLDNTWDNMVKPMLRPPSESREDGRSMVDLKAELTQFVNRWCGIDILFKRYHTTTYIGAPFTFNMRNKIVLPA